MSADIVAELHVPISLAMLLGGGHHTLVELLGGVAVPDLACTPTVAPCDMRSQVGAPGRRCRAGADHDR